MRILRHLAALLVVAGAVTAGSATVAMADPVPCDQQCQLQWDLQRQDALPRTSFYDPPDPLQWAPPGTLIRQQATSGYQVSGLTTPVIHILYHSRTSAGQDVAASSPPGSTAGPRPRRSSR